MKKILLLHYFGGAGGKFIANCLTYSQKVAVQNFNLATQLKQHFDQNVLEQHLLSIIPDKNQSREWLNLEFGCWQLFGTGINNVKQQTTFKTSWNDVNTLNNIWLPVMSHTIHEFTNLKDYFANEQVFTVLVNSTPEFIDRSIRLKWPMQHHCLDLDLYKVFLNDLNKHQFDFVFDDWSPLISNELDKIKDLAEKLDINFDFLIAKNYINKYINFYQ